MYLIDLETQLIYPFNEFRARVAPNAVCISDEDKERFEQAIAQNHRILSDLSISEPKPSAGCVWDSEQGKWVDCETVESERLEQAKLNALILLKYQVQEFLDDLSETRITPEHEVRTWTSQRDEVLAWKSNPDIETPILAEIAKFRGIDLEVLKQKTLYKATLYQTLVNRVVGKRQSIEDLIKQAKTLDDLSSIDLGSFKNGVFDGLEI